MTTLELLEKIVSNTSLDDNMEKLIFLQDVVLCQGIIAWKNMKINFINAEIYSNELSWEELWNYSEFDLDDFAILIGKKYAEAEDILKRLVSLKYIYPDGGVNEVALAYAKNISKNMLAKVISQSKIKGETKDGRK